MNKDIMKVRSLLLIGIICLVIGFLICAKGPENVFIGSIVLIASSCIFIAALYPAIRICQLRKKHDDVKK